eukprot:TRINITY_DN3137_c2_g2_i1.p1 TRINITY_DN3137_c2_g2~~TRINITY_DN3137_c2_g2_i1.p1  ORF type:complete len:189 (-),score=26.57 TRINITY_DN3137_c2_g2_i1:78-644(-)
MGLKLSKLPWLQRLVGLQSRKCRMLLLGLDNAGKTTLLYNLKLGDVVQTIPTVGFNVETLTYKNLSFNVWDVGGQDAIRKLWRYYYQGSDGLIFVIDSADRERLALAREELEAVLDDPLMRDAFVLIYANKQDLPDAMSCATIADGLGLHEWRTRQWYIQASNAKSGDGLYEGMDWLSETFRTVQSSR